MSRDKALPESLSIISKRHKTPTVALTLTMVFTISAVLFGDISTVANATVFGVLVTFILVNLSLIALRRRQPYLERPFKLKPKIGYMPIISLLGAMSCFALLFNYIFDWLILLIQLVIVLCGIITFVAMKSKIETRTRR